MALTDYKPFQTVKINSYTQLDIVPHSSIEAVTFEKCADPKEPLGGYYSSKEKKPQIMINGGLFNMSTGHNVMSFVCDGKEQNYQNGFTGMGVLGSDPAKLVYGTDKARKWKYFMTAYPMLVINGKANTVYGNASNLNYLTLRSAVGVREDGTLLILTVDKPGMKFAEMAKIFVEYDAQYAMNLDGGGSVRKMHENKVVNTPIENRPVDNVFCVYLKEDPLAKLADQNEIASWARPYVEKMVVSGIMQGDANGKFRPKAAVTREELAAVIARVLNKG
nr:phosphodiester glycosidase family protein [Butyricicoccus sp. AF05-36]